MITSIPSLSTKKQIKTPKKLKINLNNQDIFQVNDKSITTNESYSISGKKSNIKKTRNINYINNIDNDNIDNNLKYTNSNNLDNILNINNIYNINKSKNINRSISPSKADINSILNPKFLTIINNTIQPNPNKIIKLPQPITVLPKISKKVLLTEADVLVKKRKKQDGLIAPHIATNITLKRSGEINLKNYVIRKIKEKRVELKNDEKKMTENFKKNKKIYDKRYKGFLDSIEAEQRKQKDEENELYKLRLEIDNQTNILNKELIKNKKLLSEIKKIINSIISFTKYGSFIHKVFEHKFIYEELKDLDGKDFYYVMNKYIDIYDKYIQDKIFQNEEKEFLNILLSNGVNYLSTLFFDMEEKIRIHLNNNNAINEEITNLNNKNTNEINLLMNKRNERENDKMMLNEDQKKQTLLIKDFEDYDIKENYIYLKYIIELNEILVENKKKKLINDFVVNEDTKLFCDDTIKKLEQKESLINKYIIEIENIFKNGNNKDKSLIEEIVEDKKKMNLKQKVEIRKIQEENEMKKKVKTKDEQRIVIKGRKVIQDFPLIKNNKKKKKVLSKKKNDDYDYLYYSSDEN